MTLATIIETLKMIALKHPNVNSAYEGNIYDILNSNPNNKYASVVITQQSHTTDEVYDHYGFVIFYVDRLVDDMEDNRVQIQSCGKSMLGNIITFFCEEFDAECENISFQPFTQRFVDETAGIYSTITIDVPKDVICPEEYWNEDWVAPVTVIRNQDKRVVFTENGTYTIDYDPTTYTGLGNVEVNVNIDVDSYYNQGKTDGINEQKSKLESINITENGTYTKEDGYNEIVVNVPDLNGDYNEGYEQGQADVAANARVLEVTENGTYLSKFSDPIIPTTVTGVYADGTEFYSYAELSNKIFNTKIAGSVDSRLEFWYKGDNTLSGDAFNVIIGSGNNDNSDCFQVRYDTFSNNGLLIEVGNTTINVSGWDDTVWHHLIISKAEGLWIDGEKKGDFSPTNAINGEFFINGIGYSNTRNANGCFGMIKIDDIIIIPTADGFRNVNTGELLEVAQNGAYTFTENLPIYGEGELYKTINVNVIPKINLQKEGIKLAYGRFKEIPEWADFEGIIDMSRMFYECKNLETIPLLDTSNVTDMNNMFNACSKLQTIPIIDTSNVADMSFMFANCTKLNTLPNNLNFGNCNNMSNCFSNTPITDYSFLETWTINPNASMDAMISNYDITYVPAIPCVGSTSYYQSAIFWAYSDYSKLTYFGGWIGRKYNVDKNYILTKMPNLTYESCISILNNLYDFTGNGEIPDSNQAKLKVHANFLKTVGDEISIGVAKGWVISA